MKPTRRDFLKQAGAVTISGVVIGCGDSGSVEADAAVVAAAPEAALVLIPSVAITMNEKS